MTRKEAIERKAREILETAETLVDDRGRAGALAWALHCMVRDPVGGFWRAVADAIREGGAREDFSAGGWFDL